MKRLLSILLVGGLVLQLSSCGNDFLDLAPISNANDKNFYSNESEIVTAMSSAYETLYNIYGPLGPVYLFGSLASDDAYTTESNSDSDYRGIQNVDVKIDNKYVLSSWNGFYSSITIINNILEKSEGLDYANKAAHQAEMKFLRALYYFNMVQIWGGVPVVTTKLDVDESYDKLRDTEADVYRLIIEDLTFGIQNLPNKANARAVGTATRGAAYALLGKVYLTQGDKSAAATTLLNIYNTEYSLEPNYANLWGLNKNTRESIFEVQYLGGAGNPYSTYWAYYSPHNNVGAVTAQGGGHNQVTDDLWEAYEANDPRRDISVSDGYYNLDHVHIETRFPIKWVDENAPAPNKLEMGDNNFMILRYADVLLMLTEATGDAKYMNEVRNRANPDLPKYGEAGYPSEFNTIDLAVEHERHVELAMEFHRFFDLERTGRAITVLKESDKNLTITANKLVWPIPLDVIDTNPLWKDQQNPGY